MDSHQFPSIGKPNANAMSKNKIVWQRAMGKPERVKLSKYVSFFIGEMAIRLMNEVFLSPAMFIAVNILVNV